MVLHHAYDDTDLSLHVNRSHWAKDARKGPPINQSVEPPARWDATSPRTALKDLGLSLTGSHTIWRRYTYEYAHLDTVHRPCADGPAVRRNSKCQYRRPPSSIEAACLALVFRHLHSIDSVRPKTLSVPNRTDSRVRAIHYSGLATNHVWCRSRLSDSCEG